MNDKKYTEEEIKRVTRRVLDKLDIKASLKGYTYIPEIMWIMYNDSGFTKITYVYAMCGKIYNVNASRVERAIRHAISRIDLDNPYYKSILNETCSFENKAILILIYLYIMDELSDNISLDPIGNDKYEKLVSRIKVLEEDVELLKRIVLKERTVQK